MRAKTEAFFVPLLRELREPQNGAAFSFQGAERKETPDSLRVSVKPINPLTFHREAAARGIFRRFVACCAVCCYEACLLNHNNHKVVDGVMVRINSRKYFVASASGLNTPADFHLPHSPPASPANYKLKKKKKKVPTRRGQPRANSNEVIVTTINQLIIMNIY